MGNRGGARAGAGRPRKLVKFAGPIATAEQRIADRLPQCISNLEILADGGFQQVTETWELAAHVTKDEWERVEGPRGGVKLVKKSAPLFPDAKPDQLVCTKRTITYAAPDRGANEYLIDRITGRATVLDDPEPEDTGKVDVTDAARAAALERANAWRQKNAQQLSNIKNPLGDQSSSLDSTTTDEN